MNIPVFFKFLCILLVVSQGSRIAGPWNYLVSPFVVKEPQGSFPLAIADSPTWHRRKRARRSSARKRVRAFLDRLSDNRVELARKGVKLLERQHSAPHYSKFRRIAFRMSQWSSWTYWGQGPGMHIHPTLRCFPSGRHLVVSDGFSFITL